MNATYVFGKYDADGNLIHDHLYSDKSLVDISEVEAQRQYQAFMMLAKEFGIKGKSTLFKLDPIQTIEI